MCLHMGSFHQQGTAEEIKGKGPEFLQHFLRLLKAPSGVTTVGEGGIKRDVTEVYTPREELGKATRLAGENNRHRN